MMTLDEAIKHAEEVAEENEKFCYKKGGKGGYFNEDTDWNNIKCAEEHRQLAEWLKELKQLREQARWIPCSERFPEEETDVLICNSKGNIEVSRGSVFDDGTWEWYTSGWHFGEVLAWMPMPEPYEEETESEE